MNRIVPISSVAEFHRREEEQDSYQKEALRRFYERERPGMFLTWQRAFKFFAKICFIAVVGYGFIIMLIPALEEFGRIVRKAIGL